MKRQRTDQSNKPLNRINKLRLSLLATSMLSCSIASSTHASVVYDVNGVSSITRIGDLSIYQAAQDASPSLTMMLDLTGSMETYDIPLGGVPFENSSQRYEINIPFKLVDPQNPANTYSGQYKVRAGLKRGGTLLPSNTSGWTDAEIRSHILKNYYLNRLSVLKDAMINLMVTPGAISDNVRMAIGEFNGAPPNFVNGRIRVPIARLDYQQRRKIIDALILPYVGSTTPTSVALAEAGAYMMGTNTQYPFNNSDYYFPNHLIVAKRSISTGIKNTCQVIDLTKSMLAIPYDNPNYGTYNLPVFNCKVWSEDLTQFENGEIPYVQAYNGQDGYGPKIQEFTLGDTVYYLLTTGVVNTFSGFTPRSPYYGTPPIPQPTSDAGAKEEDHYKKAAEAATCAGNGIYLMTDGIPTGVPTIYAKMTMNRSLGLNSNMYVDCKTNAAIGLIDTDINVNWSCMGQYTKLLRNSANPGGVPIRVATAGLGEDFNGLLKKTVTIGGVSREVYDCDSSMQMPNQNNPNVLFPVKSDARNLCRLGEISYGYGEGGFTHLLNSEDISKSVIRFIGELNQTIPSSPAGTLSVPIDPYQAGRGGAQAYLPMVEPKVEKAVSTWQGNLKAFAIKNATLYGKNDQKLFSNQYGTLNDLAIDLWSSKSSGTGNAAIDSGGVFEKLKAPISTNIGNIRQLFVEDYNTIDDQNIVTQTVKITLDADHKATNIIDINDSVYGTGAALNQARRTLLNFLGFKLDPTADLETEVNTIDLGQQIPTATIQNLGGVIHSAPVTVSYSAKLDNTGRVSNTDREDYVLFGSMDGALHLVDAKTGDEQWAFIPKIMYLNQPDALIKNNAGVLKFGIDASWVVKAEYQYTKGADNVSDTLKLLQSPTAEQETRVYSTNYVPMAAYGGFRMGAKGLYGLDITDKTTPKILFSITPDSLDGDATLKNDQGVAQTGASADYSNVGQIWSRPTLARVRNTDITKNTDVIIFGGGYDMRYEDPNFVPPSDTSNRTKGSSVYITDAKTGSLIWRWDNPNNHSIVGGITALDRNADGLFDHLYFADLGGNVYRSDFINKAGTAIRNVRTIRVFNASALLPHTDDNNKQHLAYRFYEAPVVSFYRDKNNKIMGVVNIASGDRSSPLANNRTDNTYANRLYGILDTDIAKVDVLTSDFTPTISELTENDMTKLGGEQLANSPKSQDDNLLGIFCKTNTANEFSNLCKQKVSLISPLYNQTKKGWYYPLTRFNGSEGVADIKAIGNYSVVGGDLYISTYNWRMRTSQTSSCEARVIGASEQQMYCLPYGVCADDSSQTGTGGFAPYLKGLQEITVGAINRSNSDKLSIIGTTTIAERQSASYIKTYGDDPNKTGGNGVLIDNPPVGTGTGTGGENDTNTQGSKTNGDGSTAPKIYVNRYVLRPYKWLENIDE